MDISLKKREKSAYVRMS